MAQRVATATGETTGTEAGRRRDRWRNFYQGTPVSELPSVLQYKGMAQVREIDSRLQALYLHCAENGYIMTKAHIRAVLGISHDVYGDWIAGKLLPVREGRRGRWKSGKTATG